MRKAVLSRDGLAAVFIGGMEGIWAKHTMFVDLHPGANILAVASAGGAARQLAESLGVVSELDLQNVDFSRLFHLALNVASDESRTSPA